MDRIERLFESRGCDNRGESMHTAEYGVRDGRRGDEPGPAVLGGAVVAGKGVLEPVVPSGDRSSAKNRGISRVVHRLRANRGREQQRARARPSAVNRQFAERSLDVGSEGGR